MKLDAFTVHLIEPPGEAFPIDVRDNEWLWLPRIGPTAFQVVRVVQHDFDIVGGGGTFIYRTAGLAERLGTAPSRMWATIERLIRFEFLLRHDDRPDTFTMHAGMRKPTSLELRRLPDQVLAAYRAEKAHA